jgi:hypothetical protein
MIIRAAALTAGFAVAGAVLYRRLLREPVLNWGATPDEAARELPGDELLEDADIVSTRAIAIDAPPSAIWPWLVQMGPGRAGAYTYDWIENLLGLDMHSADTVVPELQHLEVGEVIKATRGEGTGMRVELLEPRHVLATRSEDGRWVWSFVLAEKDGITRLVSRNRISTGGLSPGGKLGMAVMEPGSLVMERKMLLGIKERAERLAREESEQLVFAAR